MEQVDACPELMPAQIGEYKIVRLIGSGGMGQVYLAEHVRMQRAVALKVLPMARMKEPTAVSRFFDEIRAASRLMHPNIVTAFDAGESNGVHYLAMEYIDGETLTSLVGREGPMSVGEAASVIRQAAMGLLHAHRAGVVHRDVKPGNLMRASDGTVKVLDLGLAQVNSQQWSKARLGDVGELATKRPGRLVGTLAFMSPEQLENPDSADARSDIYSLGAVLFFLLNARPPYTGEFLDQVYGHRHGEVPELMQLRGDVDLRFDHIFRRMMAKSPSERYGSLDEVIDELADYADSKRTPLWLSELAPRSSLGEPTTASGGSTSRAATRLIGIDLGMAYLSAAESTPDGDVMMLSDSLGGRTLARLAVAGDGKSIFFGESAIARREQFPQSVVHCLPLYIGKDRVERAINETQYPPEVLLAMSLRDYVQRVWKHSTLPDAAAITVPSTYDQLHRRSTLQAAQLAGLTSVRLVDRSLAAAQTLLLEDHQGEPTDEGRRSAKGSRMILFVGLTGQACDVAIIRQKNDRMHQLSTAGHWHCGTLQWQHVLVEYVAERVEEVAGIDPRHVPASVAKLQLECERAMNAMLLSDKARVSIPLKTKHVAIVVERSEWLRRCAPLLDALVDRVHKACERAKISIDRVDQCLLLGPILRLTDIHTRLCSILTPDVNIRSIERTDVARGAAACLAAEMPGRIGMPLPPRGVTSQTIGIVIEDARGRRRILPIIPRGSVLPARTNRRLTMSSSKKSMTLALVETSGVDGRGWQSLGRYHFDVDSNIEDQTRLISFEVDINGLLCVRAQSPATGSVRLATLPKPMLSDESFSTWSASLQLDRK